MQTDLADTLEAIARDGPRAFYEGRIAEKIVAAVRSAGGLMTSDDLANYRADRAPAVRGTYRGYDIVSMPPPSSGGVHLIEMLNILEGYDLAKLGRASSAAHDDRGDEARLCRPRRFLGDPDAVKMPIAGLISKDYAAVVARRHRRQGDAGGRHQPGKPADFEGRNTTHFSVVDRYGNAVSNTYTLNFTYGVGLVADGTGILLNNELDDFAAKPGAPNAYGLVGDDANLPGPNKRPLSSMTPTIVLKDGKPVLVTGSPGGSRIITAVLQVIVNVIDFHMAIADAVAAPRIHHQWLPDEAVRRAGLARPPSSMRSTRAATSRGARRHTSANTILVTPQGFVGPPTRGRAGRWRRGISRPSSCPAGAAAPDPGSRTKFSKCIWISGSRLRRALE